MRAICRYKKKKHRSFFDGAQTRNRTKDTGIFSPLLYQLSYLGILLINNIMVGHQGLEPRTCRV